MSVRKLFFPDSYSKRFPIRKQDFLGKIKENKGLCGGVYEYAAQVTQKFDAEILKKVCFRMETN